VVEYATAYKVSSNKCLATVTYTYLPHFNRINAHLSVNSPLLGQPELTGYPLVGWLVVFNRTFYTI